MGYVSLLVVEEGDGALVQHYHFASESDVY